MSENLGTTELYLSAVETFSQADFYELREYVEDVARNVKDGVNEFSVDDEMAVAAMDMVGRQLESPEEYADALRYYCQNSELTNRPEDSVEKILADFFQDESERRYIR